MQLEPDEVDADAEEFLNELNLLSDVPVVYPGNDRYVNHLVLQHTLRSDPFYGEEFVQLFY